MHLFIPLLLYSQYLRAYCQNIDSSCSARWRAIHLVQRSKTSRRGIAAHAFLNGRRRLESEDHYSRCRRLALIISVPSPMMTTLLKTGREYICCVRLQECSM
ncbi:hypothetical protein F4861DRAFT_512948 [Xylaria intraflava]|nr:hypothetical protein F4861DRAFT_512948 [Xylaria intraflava]